MTEHEADCIQEMNHMIDGKTDQGKAELTSAPPVRDRGEDRWIEDERQRRLLKTFNCRGIGMHGLGKYLLIGAVSGSRTFYATCSIASSRPAEYLGKIGPDTEKDTRAIDIVCQVKRKYKFQEIEFHYSARFFHERLR